MSQFTFSLFSLSNLMIAICYWPLFLFLHRNATSRAAQIFSLHILATVVWGFFGLLGSIIVVESISFFFYKIACIGVLFISIFFTHATYLLTDCKKKWLLTAAYAYGTIYTPLIIFDQLSPGVFWAFDSFLFLRSSVIYYISFCIWTSLILYSHILLINYYLKEGARQRKDILFLMFAFAGLCAGATNFFAADGRIYPFGNFFVPLHSLGIAYSIFRYNLLEIRIEFKKGFVYYAALVMLALLYSLIIYTISRITSGFNAEPLSYVKVGLAFMLGLLFLPLKERLQSIIFEGDPLKLAYQNQQLKEHLTESQKHASLSIVSSGIAHEIKNPLTAINTFCELLPRKMHDPEYLTKFSRIMCKEVSRINGLVHQLLDYAKPAPLTLELTKVHPLIEEVLNVLSSQFLSKGITVVKDFTPENFLKLWIDPNQIRQALLNLFLNAQDAMPDGGTLTLKTTVTGNSFNFDIQDTGCGMDKKELSRIFEPFVTGKANGTGLGMPITQSIIEQHQGRIRIKSEKGLGTTVKITLRREKPSVGT